MQKVNNNGVAFSIQRAAWVRQMMLGLMLCVSVGFVTGCKEDDEPSIENASLYAIDREFLMQAAQSNLAEVELSNLALQKSTDPQVREYATMMVNEHTIAQTELRTLGDTKKLTVQTQLNEVNQAKREQLNALAGAQFDQAYMRGQVASHQVTSGKFATQLDNGRDNELKAYATKYKPGIDRHLQMAQLIVSTKGY